MGCVPTRPRPAKPPTGMFSGYSMPGSPSPEPAPALVTLTTLVPPQSIRTRSLFTRKEGETTDEGVVHETSADAGLPLP